MDDVRELELASNLVITNLDYFLTNYKYSTGEDCNIDELITRINNLDNIVYYFDNRFRNTTEENALIAWIDTGKRNQYGNEIFISLVKSFGVFEGFVVGYAGYIMKKFLEHGVKNPAEFKENVSRFVKKYEENNGEVEIDETAEAEAKQPYADIIDVVTETRESLLLDKWETPEGFRRFLLIIGARAQYYVNKNMDEYFVKNNIGSIIVNTGLLNKYGQYIHVLYRVHLKENGYRPYMMVKSKTMYVENGFTSEDAIKVLKPITFIDEDTVPFSTDIAEYDSSFSSLSHCVTDRRDRFPEEVKDVPELHLAQKLSQELNIGLSIHRCGGSYAKPIYKAKENEIQWVLPLHVNRDINEAPELVMVISKRGAFYDIRTILTYDGEVKDSIRAVAPYADLW